MSHALPRVAVQNQTWSVSMAPRAPSTMKPARLAWPAAAYAPAAASRIRPGNGRPVASISAPTKTTRYACATKASQSGRSASITRTWCKRGATAPDRDAVRRARRRRRRPGAGAPRSGRDLRAAPTSRQATRRTTGRQRRRRARGGAGRAAGAAARRGGRRRRRGARRLRPAALARGARGARGAWRAPPARLHDVCLASPQPPRAAAVAPSPPAPHPSRPRRLDRAALPRRRAAPLVRLARGPDRGDRTVGGARARLRGGVRDGDRVPPQQLAAAASARSRADGRRGHAAHARHPSLDPRGGDEQQLVGHDVVVGSAASHAAARPARRDAPGRGTGVSRAAERCGPAGAAVPAPTPGVGGVIRVVRLYHYGVRRRPRVPG